MDFIEHQQELTTLVDNILSEAKRQGADQAEVSASMERGLGVSVRKGELENLEFNQDRGFGITLYVGKRKGSASTTDSSPDAIRETVAAAKGIASHTEEDPFSGLAEASLMPTQSVDLDLYHPWDIEPEQATAMAVECEAAGLSVDKKLTNSDGAQISSQQALRVYGNSHGFIGAYPSTRHSMSCVLIGEDNDGMQRDYWYSLSRRWQELESAVDIGVKAAERTVQRLSPQKAPTGKYPVVLAPNLAAGLIGHLNGAISGGSQYRKASFLLDALGQQVLPSWLSLREESQMSGGLASAYFDGDGVATRNNVFVESGNLSNYILSSYSARKLGLATTGNAGGVHNLHLDAPMQPLSALLAQMGNGFFITELMGQGVNGVTGDYSRGASGYWVENGEIAYPVAEFTLAGNLKDMLLNIVALADDIDVRSSILAPSMLLESMTVAG
ncbi:MAG: metalloprotease PmbA, partial [Pseudomonadota bacterium]|nr:metalloprotease PmbA [Pseudomonadota bacterium]